MDGSDDSDGGGDSGVVGLDASVGPDVGGSGDASALSVVTREEADDVDAPDVVTDVVPEVSEAASSQAAAVTNIAASTKLRRLTKNLLPGLKLDDGIEFPRSQPLRTTRTGLTPGTTCCPNFNTTHSRVSASLRMLAVAACGA